MILVYHQHNAVTRVLTTQNDLWKIPEGKTIAQIFGALAHEFPNETLVWCHESLEYQLNTEQLDTLFTHNKMILSYSGSVSFLGKQIGYVEASPFINVNPKVRYPTWLMSSAVGGINTNVLALFLDHANTDQDLDYFLNSIAKRAMLKGFFCYSEPKLLKGHSIKSIQNQADLKVVFRFVKQHYKKRWLLLLLLNLTVFEKKFPVISFFGALFYKSRLQSKVTFDSVPLHSKTTLSQKETIDVIIPTIGRKKYLYDVLKDLASQTHLPTKVIIVEQNPLELTVSELDFLTNEDWPFIIKAIFTHQAGACNARNLALQEVTSDWVFLNDDDNRFGTDLLEKVLGKAHQYGCTVVTTAYLQPHEKQSYTWIHQSGIFGSGNSFVKREALKDVFFDMALEFGYGEDTDFGLQLRNKGHDVIYFPDLKITHLKAPMGGFRIPVSHPWQSQEIQPKPSPTMMYVFMKYYTAQQLASYKIVLFLKLMKKVSPLKYVYFYTEFKQKWEMSQYWARKLNNGKK